MTQDNGGIWHHNPFPSTPVVRLDSSVDLDGAGVPSADSGNVTIGTPTLTELTSLVDDYLDAPTGGGRRGRAVALVGEFGLGKSHALREVYATLGARPDAPALWIVDEPVQNMGRMYRERLRGPGHTEAGKRAFEELVTDYYAYVIAGRVGEQGEDPRLGRLDVAAGLRDRSLDPDKVVAALRYDPDVIHTDLRRKLGEVTEHRRFATALALLQAPQFTKMVWAWLNGDEPAEPLRERGITEAIGSPPGDGRQDAAVGIDRVFDALAVLGFVHGRVGSPYVLLMDSLERVLDWPEESRRTFVDAFERLVNIYVSRGGLMVFCVSPDGLSAFRPSLHERVVQLWPTGFDESLTGNLVAGYLDAGAAPTDDTGRPALPGPFGAPAVAQLHRLTEGVPREVLRTCHRAWQLSEDAQGAVRRVTAASVSQAVRVLHERASRQQVVDAVREALDRGQWRVASTDPVAERLSSPPDTGQEVVYWLEPAPNAYLAVLLAPSVLDENDAERVTDHVRSLHDAVLPARLEVLLVVNGHVTHAMQDRLGRDIGSRPLVHRRTGFAAAVDEALSALTRRLTDTRRATDLAELGGSVRRDLARQSGQLDELRRVLLAELGKTGAAARRGGPPAGTTQPAATTEPLEPGTTDLPEPVTRRFREALSVLDTVVGRLTGRAGVARGAVTETELGLLGCATLLRALTEKFRSDVVDWHRGPRAAGPRDGGRAELRRICREYESSVEVLPVHRLDRGVSPQRPTAVGTVEGLAEQIWGTLSAAAAP